MNKTHIACTLVVTTAPRPPKHVMNSLMICPGSIMIHHVTVAK